MSEQAYGTQIGAGQGDGTSNQPSVQDDSNQQGSQPNGMDQIKSNEQQVTMEYLKEMEERLARQQQSFSDRLESRVNKEIKAAFDDANRSIELGKAAGLKYTAQQEQQIRDHAMNQARAKAYQEQSQPNPSQPQQGREVGNQSEVVAYVNKEVQRIMRETGVYIDPKEADAMIVGEGDNRNTQLTPYQYIQAFESLARQRQPNIQPQGPSTRIPSYATGGKPSTSQTALRQQFDKEMTQIRQGTHPTIRRGNAKGINDLEISYRQKGLEL